MYARVSRSREARGFGRDDLNLMLVKVVSICNLKGLDSERLVYSVLHTRF